MECGTIEHGVWTEAGKTISIAKHYYRAHGGSTVRYRQETRSACAILDIAYERAIKTRRDYNITTVVVSIVVLRTMYPTTYAYEATSSER